MKARIVSQDGKTQVVEVELDSTEVDDEFKRAFNRYRKSLVVPGFRKGRAPDSAVRTKFGGRVKSEVRDSLLEAYTLWALDAVNIHLLAAPKTEIDGELKEGQPFRFTVTTESNVVPKMRGYDKIEVEVPGVPDITEQKLDEMIEDIRRRAATLKPAEGPDVSVAEGDRITVDVAFLGKETDEVLISAPNEAVDIQSAGTELLGKVLLGRKLGAKETFDYVVPEDFADESFRGKEIRASLEVKEIKKLELPPKDDSLAKMVGQAETLEGLKAFLKERLAEQHEKDYLSFKQDAMFGRLIELNPFELHPQLIIRRTSQTLRGMAERGMIKKDVTQEELSNVANSIRPIVVQSVLKEIITAQIAIQENITVSDEEIDEVLSESGIEAQKDKNASNYLVERTRLRLSACKSIMERKTEALLAKRLEVTDVQPKTEAAEPDEE